MTHQKEHRDPTHDCSPHQWHTHYLTVGEWLDNEAPEQPPIDAAAKARNRGRFRVRRRA